MLLLFWTVQLSFTFELLLPCRVVGLQRWANLHYCTEPLSLLPVSFIQYVHVISSNEPSHFYQWVTSSSLMSHAFSRYSPAMSHHISTMSHFIFTNEPWHPHQWALSSPLSSHHISPMSHFIFTNEPCFLTLFSSAVTPAFIKFLNTDF